MATEKNHEKKIKRSFFVVEKSSKNDQTTKTKWKRQNRNTHKKKMIEKVFKKETIFLKKKTTKK